MSDIPLSPLVPGATDEPLDREILRWLTTQPVSWTEVRPDALTSAEAQALKLLVRAGMVEARTRFQLTITLRRWLWSVRREWAELLFRVLGEWTRRDVAEALMKAVPPRWLDRHSRTKGPIDIATGGFHQARLTDQGEVARQDLAAGETTRVLDFVCRRGFFEERKLVTPQIVLENRREESASAAGPPGGPATAIAKASASVGDVVVHSHVHVDAGSLLSGLEERIAQAVRRATENDESPVNTGQGGGKVRSQEGAGAPPPAGTEQVMPDITEARPKAPQRPPNATEQAVIDLLFKLGIIGLQALKALPHEKRPTGEWLAPQAIGRACDGQFKTTLAHMVDLGWLDNGRNHGMGSGYFLTDTGAALVTRRRRSGPGQD